MKRLLSLLFAILIMAGSLLARDFVVVIDPGHGGIDAGCVGKHGYEKDIVLSVAKQLGKKITDNYSNVKVIYTRSTDVFIPLQQRANTANRNHADLFISIHVNSVDLKTKGRSSVRGASVYTLGADRTALNLEVAKRENEVITLEDDYTETYGGFDPSNPESAIMIGLLQNRYINGSIDFASRAQSELVNTAGRHNNDIKQAGFLVLRNVSAPAVLVELDFICNPTQEQFLISASGQAKMATALYNAFSSYYKSCVKQAQAAQPNAKTPKATADKGDKGTADPAPATAPAAAGATVYKIQFLTSGSLIKDGSTQFKGLTDVAHYKDGTTYKYTVGEYATFKQAQKALPEVRTKFPQAFIITWRDGQRIK